MRQPLGRRIRMRLGNAMLDLRGAISWPGRVERHTIVLARELVLVRERLAALERSAENDRAAGDSVEALAARVEHVAHVLSRDIVIMQRQLRAIEGEFRTNAGLKGLETRMEALAEMNAARFNYVLAEHGAVKPLLAELTALRDELIAMRDERVAKKPSPEAPVHHTSNGSTNGSTHAGKSTSLHDVP